MSADNWTQCPKCNFDREAEADAKDAFAESQYGKVPINEYHNLLTEAAAFRESVPDLIEEDRTLSEDYDIGIFGSEFEVNYRATCHKCGYTFKYDIVVKDIAKAKK